MKPTKDFFDLPESEQKKIVDKSAREANEMQSKISKKAMKPKHDPLCLYQVSVCDCGAREKLMPMYIKRQKKILKRMSSKVGRVWG